MGRIGLPEMLVIFAIVLLIFGPKRLPDLARGLGQAIRGFKDAVQSQLSPKAERPNEAAPSRLLRSYSSV